jgi:hypothetical protein
MQTYQKIAATIGRLACASAMLMATASQAQVLEYHVDVNTSALIGNANAPFYLDFQLNYGSGPSGNSASIGNFTGVTPAGSPNLTGTAGGNLSTSVMLSDNSVNPFNEFYQQFTPGAHAGFDVFLSHNATLLTPDSLQFAILDNTTGQIPTAQPSVGLSLAEFDINANGTITATGFGGVNDPVLGNYSGITVTVTPVPEPSVTLLGLCAGGALIMKLCRARKPGAKAA